MKKLIIGLCAVMSLSTALTIKAQSDFKNNAQVTRQTQSTSSNDGILTYHLLQSSLQESHLKNYQNTNLLESEIKIQAEKIRQLEKIITRLDKPQDTGIATTVLSAATLMVTALGVLIAILSILGYRNIKKEAMKDARKTARDVVKQITLNELPRETKEIITHLLEKKAFDNIILNAVEKVAYRGISITDDEIDNGI